MDNSKEFNLMLDRAIEAHPEDFRGFDRTKNVQDQLQEMVNPYEREQNQEWHSQNKAYDLLRVFMSFCCGDEYEMSQPTSYAEKFTSMEQLWLAFVMEECYNKVWSTEKEEWEKE